MTAATVSSFEGVLWRPAAALRVAHKPNQDRRLAATVLAAICALTLLFAAAPHATSVDLFGTETSVAAQTDPSATGIRAQPREEPHQMQHP